MMKIDKRERIIRVILNYPKGSLSAYKIAKEAECSRSWVIDFLHKLEKMKLVKKISNISESNRKIEGICVIDAIGIFKYWLKIRPSIEFAEYHLQKDPLTIIKNSKLSYALTTYQADNLIQRYLFPTRTDIYILKDELDVWHKILLSHGLVGPGNTRIIIADPHLIKNAIKRKGYYIVSKSQLICDLLMEGGVALDAANLLIRKWYSEFIR